MKKYKTEGLHKWSYKTFKRDCLALTGPEIEGLKREMLDYVMKQENFNSYDARFLKRVGYGVFYIKGKSEKRKEEFKKVSLFWSEDYCITPKFFIRGFKHGQDFELIGDFDDLADQYFTNANKHNLSLRILHGNFTDEKLIFKDKTSEKDFIMSMADLIPGVIKIKRETLAERIEKGTNTELTKQQIINVIENYRE